MAAGVVGGCDQRALQQRGQQRRAHALSRNVRHHRAPAMRVHRRHVEVIAAHLVRRHAAAAGPQPSLGGQFPGQQALLDGPRQAQLFLHLVLGPLLFQQARVFEHRGGLDGQRLQQFAVAARQVGRRQARIHVEHAHGFAARREDAGGFALARPDAHQRDADHAAQLQVRDARLRPRLAFAQGVEVHGEQLPPAFQRAVDHLARHAQVARRADGARAGGGRCASPGRRRRAAAGSRARRR